MAKRFQLFDEKGNAIEPITSAESVKINELNGGGYLSDILQDMKEDRTKSPQLFIDMWNTAGHLNGRLATPCAKYDPEGAPDAEHPFLLNGLYLNFDEAYNAFLLYPLCVSNSRDKSWMFYGLSLNCRTLFPIAIVGMSAQSNISYCFEGNPDIEVVRFYHSNTVAPFNIDFRSSFKNCTGLRVVEGRINLTSTSDTYLGQMFLGCKSLESVTFQNLKCNVSFSDCPKLSYDSLQYMIKNAINTAAITITVHADVWAKLQDEENEEWHALLALAESKNITFATA